MDTQSTEPRAAPTEEGSLHVSYNCHCHCHPHRLQVPCFSSAQEEIHPEASVQCGVEVNGGSLTLSLTLHLPLVS